MDVEMIKAIASLWTLALVVVIGLAIIIFRQELKGILERFKEFQYKKGKEGTEFSVKTDWEERPLELKTESVAKAEQPNEDSIRWNNSGNLFWASHDLMLTIDALLRDAPSETIVYGLQQSLHHVQALGFNGPPVESKLAGLTAGAKGTLGQSQIWTPQLRELYVKKLEPLKDTMGDLASANQQDFDSGPKGTIIFAPYSFEHDFWTGLKDAWMTPSGWLPQVDSERGVLLTRVPSSDDLSKVLLLEELPLFLNGEIECEVCLEPGALFDMMLRGSFDVKQPVSLDHEYYMVRFDTRPGFPDCILIKPKGNAYWHECNDRNVLKHHSPHGQWLTMRVEANGQRISLYRDGILVDQIDNAKVTTGRIGLFTELANVYVKNIRIQVSR